MPVTDVDRLVLTKARLLAEEGIERARVYTQGHPDADRLKAMAVVALDLCDRVEQAWAEASNPVRFVATPEVAVEVPVESKPWYRRML